MHIQLYTYILSVFSLSFKMELISLSTLWMTADSSLSGVSFGVGASFGHLSTILLVVLTLNCHVERMGHAQLPNVNYQTGTNGANLATVA